MPWTEITAGTPELTFKTNGLLEWNTALQILLSDPSWVNLMWDPDERHLGVRGVCFMQGLPVYSEKDKGEYKIDSSDLPNEAGISVNETLSAEPTKATEPIRTGEFAYFPIYHITLPE